MLPKITEAELLADLSAIGARENDSDGLTAADMADRIGKSATWVRQKLNLAKRAGRLVTGSTQIERLNDVPMTVRTYRVLPQQE